MNINEALNILQSSEVVKLTCVRKQGSGQGQIYQKWCRFGAPDGHEKKPMSEKKTGAAPKTARQHVENGTLPMTEVGENGELDRYFSPNIYHVIQLNNQNIYR